MFAKKNKTIMKKKKMWPSIVVFCLFLAACAGSVAISFAQFRLSEMNAGLASMQDERMQVGYMLEKLLGETGKSPDAVSPAEWKEMLDKVVKYQWEEFSLCITDKDGSVISSTDDILPDFQKSVIFELGKDYIILCRCR